MIDTAQRIPWSTRAMNHFRTRPDRIFLYAFILPLLVILVLILVYVSDWFGIYSRNKDGIWALLPAIVTSLVIVFSAFLAAAFTIQGINSARETARLQETLKIITEAELDREFIEAKNAWTKYKSLGKRDNCFAGLLHVFILGFDGLPLQDESGNDYFKARDRKKLRVDAQYVITYLNFFEIASLSINEGILDDAFFRKWYGTNFIRVWNNSISAIGALRTLLNNERLYAEWETRAHVWSRELKTKVRDPIIYGSLDLANITREALKDLRQLASEEG
jgi:hypothetical protein